MWRVAPGGDVVWYRLDLISDAPDGPQSSGLHLKVTGDNVVSDVTPIIYDHSMSEVLQLLDLRLCVVQDSPYHAEAA